MDTRPAGTAADCGSKLSEFFCFIISKWSCGDGGQQCGENSQRDAEYVCERRSIQLLMA